MFTGSMMKLKSILYGTLPFYYTKVFEPSSPKLAYYDYFRKRGYTRSVSYTHLTLPTKA